MLGNCEGDDSSAVGRARRFAGKPGGPFDDNDRLNFDVPNDSTCGPSVSVAINEVDRPLPTHSV